MKFLGWVATLLVIVKETYELYETYERHKRRKEYEEREQRADQERRALLAVVEDISDSLYVIARRIAPDAPELGVDPERFKKEAS